MYYRCQVFQWVDKTHKIEVDPDINLPAELYQLAANLLEAGACIELPKLMTIESRIAKDGYTYIAEGEGSVDIFADSWSGLYRGLLRFLGEDEQIEL